MKSYGKRIKKVVKEARAMKSGLTQYDLDRALLGANGKGQFVSNIERGLCGLPSKYVNKLSTITGMPRDVIVDAMVQDFEESLKIEVYGNSAYSRESV